MANWYGSARTNYVRLAPGVTVEDLKNRLELLGVDLEIWSKTQHTGDAEETLVGFGPGRNSEDGAFPGFLYFDLEENDERIDDLMKLFGYDEEEAFRNAVDNSEIEFEWDKIIMPLVAVGEVLVVQVIGAEKLRYLTGLAVAFIRREDGRVEIVSIGIDDIYDKARKQFGLSDTHAITAAEY
jgi:hypothetical protein